MNSFQIHCSLLTISLTLNSLFAVAACFQQATTFQSRNTSQQKRGWYPSVTTYTNVRSFKSALFISRYNKHHHNSHHSPLFSNFQSEDQKDMDENNGVATLRHEIEQMKQEARLKLNKLEKSFSSQSATSSNTQDILIKNESIRNQNQNEQVLSEQDVLVSEIQPKNSNINFVSDVNNSDRVTMATEEKQKTSSNDKFREKTAISNKVSLSSPKEAHDVLSLLDDTNWKISLNIGREPSTWMPKDWGISGERLLLNLELIFTDKQLYEREEFLGSMGGAKILTVKNNECILSPTIKEGARKIRILDGGWRVAQGSGPMNTDMLKFYIEIEEEVKRKDPESDIYIPKGRIYCSCGYFPSKKQSSGFKQRLKQQLDSMILKAEQLDDEIANEGPFSLIRFKKQTELFRLKVEMQETGERLMSASVVEPNRSLLKLSQDGSVGLTREGGVCCKVSKGQFAIEYHILGKFSITSVPTRAS